MPEYLSPGVYVEDEIGAKPIEGVSTSTAGFLGEAERGPTTPRFITSWTQYQRVYGSYFGSDKYLPYAVEGFFKNGGQRCYLERIVGGTTNNTNPAISANAILTDKDGANTLTITAIGEGEWGNNITFKVENGTQNKEEEFKLSFFYWKDKVPVPFFDPNEDRKSIPRPSVIEVYDDLSMDSSSHNFYEKSINEASNLIMIKKTGTSTNKPKSHGGRDISEDRTFSFCCGILSGGKETRITLSDYQGKDDGNNSTGLLAFTKIDDISILYSPNSSESLTKELIAHCENLKDRFVIIDAPEKTPVTVSPRDIFETKYGAYYYPWIKIIESQNGMKKLIPPGGYIAGIYARNDVERGVHKAPANEVVRGVVDLEFPVTKGDQDILNPRGVNCIRAFTGRGIRVWGARTLSSNPSWKYINIRRLFIYLEKSIGKGTQWVVFEPNNEVLWERVIQTISNFLIEVWRNGALMGVTPDKAFFVQCDRTTMTQDDIANGRLIVIIGVAPVKPAEFVIFRITQWTNNAE